MAATLPHGVQPDAAQCAFTRETRECLDRFESNVFSDPQGALAGHGKGPASQADQKGIMRGNPLFWHSNRRVTVDHLVSKDTED
ncbi:hypothetical protein BaRGS_00013965 [Batillaria attramentaria]|uniref:Uncharacterized protein n=1 Tax=Batillaria attramentaria TaxID=370345 RepID=A0ABD0L6D9_9CAEN